MRREWRDLIHARARELMQSGLLWPAAVERADNEFRCNARVKSRNHAPCRARPVEGQKRCRVHGGIVAPYKRSDEQREAARQRAYSSTGSMAGSRRRRQPAHKGKQRWPTNLGSE